MILPWLFDPAHLCVSLCLTTTHLLLLPTTVRAAVSSSQTLLTRLSLLIFRSLFKS